MKACIILHNMIVEDDSDTYLEYAYNDSPIEITHNGKSISFYYFLCLAWWTEPQNLLIEGCE
jgi:hypothetical protein